MHKFRKEPIQFSLFDASDAGSENGVQMSSPVCILRIEEVEKRVGFKRSYIYRLMKGGKFPQNGRIGIRAVGWSSHDIDQWIEARLQSPLGKEQP
ncbi:helix-turn-helix transcriptional regulator [Saezia sanguinis]|uniref:helix-turn-helix transcriptional regulator n=1 Tax=Saezia sanguinis TaxID=1965230 RepID=UPI0030755080